MIEISARHFPELDPGFIPAALWNRAYRQKVAAAPDSLPVAITLQRGHGTVSRYEIRILPQTGANAADNLRYLERTVKFLLWAKGGSVVTIAGCPKLAGEIARIYRPGGDRAFDAEIMTKIYRSPFQVLHCDYQDAPQAKEIDIALGGHFDGCRVGFDLGGSDRKCAAIQDGKVVYTEEIAWDPYFQNDINYHIDGIRDSIARAAAKLPRLDAIGGSAAGVYVDNQPRVASLFRGISADVFAQKGATVFDDLAREFNVPMVVVNDGEVTALAGALSLKKHSLLGLAMGTSEAVGYVNGDGKITDHLNELAFAPIDYRETGAPIDEWSKDAGLGCSYLSQQAVGRLAGKANFDFGQLPLPEQLKALQQAMAQGDVRAAAVYRTVGSYLGYAIAHYADFYDLRHLLLLGRVASGTGGEIILDTARQLLAEEFPGLDIAFHIPDETFKRHGQAVIAATLPQI